MDGEEIIYKHKVWLREPGLRRKKLLITSSGVLIEGLPLIPLASIKGCEIRRGNWGSPYLGLDFVDSLGDTKQVKLFHPAFFGTETGPEIETLCREIIRARRPKMADDDFQVVVHEIVDALSRKDIKAEPVEPHRFKNRVMDPEFTGAESGSLCIKLQEQDVDEIHVLALGEGQELSGV